MAEVKEENPVEKEVENTIKAINNWGNEDLSKKAEEVFFLQALKTFC